MKRWLSIALIVLGLAVNWIGQASAQEPAVISDDEVNAIARELYCPVCENIPLDVCGTQACAQWRELIRTKLGEGWSESQIKDYFAEQYGERVLAAPPPRGLNWLIYLVPPIAFLLGVVILVMALRRWKTAAPSAAVSAADAKSQVDDDYVRRLEEELKKSE